MESLGVSDKRAFLSAVPTTPLKQNSRKRKLDFDDDPVVVASGRAFCNNAHNNNNKYSGNSDSGGSPFIFHPDLQPHRPLNNNYNSQFTEIPSSAAKAVPFRFPFSLINDPNTVHCLRHSFQQRPALQQNWCASACGHLHSNVMLPYLPPYPNVVNSAVTYQFSPLHGYPYSISFPNISRGNTGNGNGLQSSNFHSPNASMGHAWGGSQTYLAPYTPEKSVQNKRLLKDKSWFSGSIYSPGGPDQKQHEARHNILDNSGLQVDKYQAEALALGLGSSATTQTNVQQKHVLSFQSATIFSGIEEIDLEANASNYFVNANVDSLHLHEKERPSAASASDTAEVDQNKIVAEKDAREDEGTAKNVDGARVFVGQIQILDFDSSQTIAHQLQTRADGNELCDADVGKGPEELDLNKLPQQRPKRKKHRPKVQAEGASKKKPRAKNAHKVEAKTTTEQEGEKAEFCSEGEKQQTDGNYHTNKITEELIETVPVTQEQVTVTPEQNAVSTEGTVRRKKQQVKENVKDLARKIHCSRLQDSSQGIPQSGDVKTLSHSRRDENPRRRTKANGKKGTKTSHPAIFLESNFQDSHRGINPSRTERTYYSLLEGVIRRMKELQIGQENNGRDDSSRLQLTLSERNHELVPYIATRDIVAYEGPLRKRKPRARVDLDNETNRVWRLLMGKASNDDKHPTDEEEKERQWEEEREVFRGRVEAFISRMHLVQGDRSFSKWKGSVVDSVVGAFLTQNVADHLSSSAFMALASRFPPYDRKSEVNAQINIKDSETGGLDLNKCVEEATELSQNMDNGTCLFPGQEFEKIKEASYSTEISQDSENESHLLVAQNADSFKDTSNYSESYASNVSSAQGTSVAMTSNCNPSEFKCRSTILDAEQFVSCDVGNNYGYEVQTLQQILQSDYNTREDQIYESDAHTFGQEIPGSEYSTDNNHTEANAQTYYNSFGELLRRVMKKAGKKVEEVDFGLSHSEIYASNFFNVTSEKEDSHSPVVESFHGQANATADPSVVQTATESRHKLPDANKALQVDLEDPSCSVPELVEDPGVQTATEAINRLPGVNKALAVDLEDRSCSLPEVIEENKSVLKENSNPSKTSSQSTIVDTIPQQNEGFCSTEEFHMFNNSDLILERMPISSSQKTENLEISSASVDKERLNLSNKSSQPSFLSPSTGYSPGTEQSECAATFCSIPQEENAFTAVVNGSTPETVPCMVQTDCQTSPDKEMHRLSIRHVENDALHLDNSNLAETPKNELNNGTSQTGRTPNRNISGIDRANIEMKQGGNKKISNWEAISERVAGYRYAYCGAKKERHANARDATDWDAVRCAEVEEIAETIKDRGMNNVLAGRIKAFLERLHSEQGCIDLEWLKDVPSDDAKDFLLSIRGLGLKSVECIRLLALQHLAFPVDTNVGRICVRLGWVPLQPLPESLQLHLLELYPVLESIQKYLWPRLCTLDQRTLYELHYQMITFGKVFCTKSRPNCNACPMRCDCKHFASAFASARLALPAPTEQSVSESGERLLQSAPENRDALEILSNLPTQYKNNDTSISNSTFPVHQLDAKPQEYCCEPIIEEPMTPEPEDTEVPESTIDDENTLDPDGIPVINLNYEQLSLNVQKIYESKSQELNDPSSETISQALVIVSPDAASIPEPKLKNVGRLRTEHRVYELPDSHPLLSRFEPREADDPSPYLLAIWGPGETPDFIGAPDQSANSMNSDRSHLEKDSCSSCTAEKYASENTVRGTMLIPCKTAMRGSFPLNGTYFQVNEVFADHLTSLNPMEVPRSWIWNLARRTVYFGTSIPTIFRGLTTEEIQYCFWRGFVCVRGFDTQVRAPRPLVARLHFPASKMVKPHKRTVENVKSKSSKQIQSGH